MCRGAGRGGGDAQPGKASGRRVSQTTAWVRAISWAHACVRSLLAQLLRECDMLALEVMKLFQLRFLAAELALQASPKGLQLAMGLYDAFCCELDRSLFVGAVGAAAGHHAFVCFILQISHRVGVFTAQLACREVQS